MFRVHLFGKFRVEYGEEPVEGLGVFKVQELLSYRVFVLSWTQWSSGWTLSGDEKDELQRSLDVRSIIVMNYIAVCAASAQRLCKNCT